VVGGKLTTAASLARDCARMMALKAQDARANPVAVASGVSIEEALATWSKSIALAGKVPAQTASAIVEWHGRRAEAIARRAAQDEALRRPLCAHSEHIVAEALEGFEHESAVKLGDILLRRVPVALGACWGDQCSLMASERIEERRRFLHPAGARVKLEDRDSLCAEGTG